MIDHLLNHKGTPVAEGSTRTKKKFAWLPKRLDDCVIVWMCNYFLKQEFKEGAWIDVETSTDRSSTTIKIKWTNRCEE